MKPSPAFRWFIGCGGSNGSNRINTLTRVTPDVPVHLVSVNTINHLKAPLLMSVDEHDEMPYCSSEVSQQVFERAPGPMQLHVIGCGHLGTIRYPSPFFDESCRVQLAFLQEQFWG
ncbi:hypothetical protein [Pelagicoccus sp. SDUM812002]|uniref:hypothetical protein n=1 Tax=Pelagicoccus sp. SDUM812002 TaxID=3041266 RepID=UPI00280E8D21|nr:hypothetical protein [Pelagicoccus sp. SDUM812002]MDQ8184672.1 hypothetical protein [Pelagicoccus sp. SDUM812002]